MKVEISSVKAHVAVHFGLQGSVLAGTIEASAPKVETSYEIESPLAETKEGRDRVAAMLRNARNGCWVRAAVANPTPFEDKSTLNGEPIEPLGNTPALT